MPGEIADIHEEATQIPKLAEIRATVEEHIPISLQTWDYQLKSQLRKPKPASSTDTISDQGNWSPLSKPVAMMSVDNCIDGNPFAPAVMYMDIYVEWAFTTTPANTNGVCHVQFRVIYEPKDISSFSTTEVRVVSLLEHGRSVKCPCKMLARWCLENWHCDYYILRQPMTLSMLSQNQACCSKVCKQFCEKPTLGRYHNTNLGALSCRCALTRRAMKRWHCPTIMMFISRGRITRYGLASSAFKVHHLQHYSINLNIVPCLCAYAKEFPTSDEPQG